MHVSFGVCCVSWGSQWEDRVREGIKRQLKDSFRLWFLTVQIRKILCTCGISLVNCKVRYAPFLECESFTQMTYLGKRPNDHVVKTECAKTEESG